MDRLYTIKCEMPLDISWDGFAPNKLTEWIEVKHSEKIKVKIGLTEDIVSSSFIHPPLDLTKTSFFTDSIILEIDGYWPEEIADLLRGHSENKDLLNAFREEIKSIIKHILFSLINHVRNHFGQYWISELSFDENYLQSVQWLDSDGSWNNLFTKSIFLKSRIVDTGIKQNDWTELGERLRNNTHVDMIEKMIANAKAHLDDENGRIAIVEAVSALESTIKQGIPRLLSEIVEPPLPDKLLESAVEKMGLRLTAQIFFEHVSGTFHLDRPSCEKCLEAIEKRNEIIHKKRYTIPLADAGEYVTAIEQIIKKLKYPFVE